MWIFSSCLFALYFLQPIFAVALPASNTKTQPAIFQIPGISPLAIGNLTARRGLQLDVYKLRAPIPEDDVVGALRGAEGVIFDLVQAVPDQAITNDRFEYRYAHESILISIAANPGEELTWLELARVLRALLTFMTGDRGSPQTHYNSLEFRILTKTTHIVGNGLFWYFHQDHQAHKRDTLPARVATNSTGVNITIPMPNPWTPSMIMITGIGDSIPSFELGAALTTALRQIQPFVRDQADTPIRNHQYWYRDRMTHVWLFLSASLPRVITWEQLSRIIATLLNWMGRDYCRELNFEVYVEDEGYTAFGSLGYDPGPQAGRREVPMVI